VPGRHATSGRFPDAECGVDADESALLALVQCDDQSACAEFVRRYGGRMFSVARRYLRNEQDAADAVQEAFLSAFSSIASFDGRSKVSTWLHRVVVNACLMKIRADRSRPVRSIAGLLPAFDQSGEHSRAIPSWSMTPADCLQTKELRSIVRDCIDCLPDPYRVVLLLRDIDGFDTQETAARLEISHAAVKVRLHRARQALRTLLEPHFAQETNAVPHDSVALLEAPCRRQTQFPTGRLPPCGASWP
jgi:RNA polymerase sigma-70 factor (ECF subfamily)